VKNSRKFFFLMLLGFIGYSLGLWALNHFYDKHSPYRYLLSLFPMLPAIYTVLVSVRAATELDEMWKKIVMEAMAFSGVATALTCFTYSFLRDMGAPEFKAWWAFGLINSYYLLGTIWAKRRYR
jgi:uncharacterized membrane protein HdeD (DUF308 family)